MAALSSISNMAITDDVKEVAMWAYKQADAMMEERQARTAFPKSHTASEAYLKQVAILEELNRHDRGGNNR